PTLIVLWACFLACGTRSAWMQDESHRIDEGLRSAPLAKNAPAANGLFLTAAPPLAPSPPERPFRPLPEAAGSRAGRTARNRAVSASSAPGNYEIGRTSEATKAPGRSRNKKKRPGATLRSRSKPRAAGAL